jgi:hypothetical protein
MSYELVVLLKLLTQVFVLTHMEACLFWYIGIMGGEEGWQAVNDELPSVSDDSSIHQVMISLILYYYG